MSQKHSLKIHVHFYVQDDSKYYYFRLIIYWLTQCLLYQMNSDKHEAEHNLYYLKDSDEFNKYILKYFIKCLKLKVLGH